MVFEYNDEGKVKINMSSYVKNITMLEGFQVKLKKSETASMPAKAYITLDKARSYARKMPKPFTHWWQKDYLYANEQDPTFSLRSHCYAHETKELKCVRLEQTHQDDEVPEQYARFEPYFEHQEPMEYKVVCGCVIRSTPRLQKSNRRNNDIQKKEQFSGYQRSKSSIQGAVQKPN